MKSSYPELKDYPGEKLNSFLIPLNLENFSPFQKIDDENLQEIDKAEGEDDWLVSQEGFAEMEFEESEDEQNDTSEENIDEVLTEFEFSGLEKDEEFYLNEFDEDFYTESELEKYSKAVVETDVLDTQPEELLEFNPEADLDEKLNLVDEEEFVELESFNISQAEPIQLPIKDPVEFARLPHLNSYWPVATSHPNGKEVPYQRQDNKFVGNSSRRFLASRLNNTRYHAGIDLYANHRDPVVACEDGKIRNFYHFYEGTYALIIEHEDLVINYGEVASDSLKINQLKVGDSVKAGQPIAVIGKMKSSSMLHFETYKKGTIANQRFIINGQKPPALLNPTKYLLRLKEVGSEANISNSNSSQQNSGIVSNWSKAIRLNNDYARKLGWINFHHQINDLLLKATNQSGISLGEEAFAKAVAIWQRKQGFSEKDSDGILGPKSWQVMKSSLSISPELSIPSSGLNSSTNTKVIPASFQGMKGVKVNSTSRPKKEQIKNEDDIIIACVSEVEGGFDTVNMYDRGIISWGIMQWTAHAGSLQKCLSYIKPRFLQKYSSSNWQQLFGGLDINIQGHFTFEGKEFPVTKNNLPLISLFRKSNDAKLISYDFETMKKWATIFALAGRDPFIQKMQMEYTALEIDKAVKYNLGNFLLRAKQNQKYTPHISLIPINLPKFNRIIQNYVGKNLKARMLYFGMWTNNPTWSIIKLFHAIESFMQKQNILSGDPNQWPSGWEKLFADELEKILRKTTVGYWGDEKAKKNNRESRTCKLIRKFISLTENRIVNCP